jgi:hypothetical protein
VKILFVDFDGVLNYYQTKQGYTFEPALETRLVERLNTIVAENDAHVVISSSWRLVAMRVNRREENESPLDVVKIWLAGAGFLHNERVIDMTPRWISYPSIRGTEIGHWLINTPLNVSGFAALDDDPNMAYVKDWHVSTYEPQDDEGDSGLRDSHYPVIKNVLARRFDKVDLTKRRDQWLEDFGKGAA